MNFRLMTTSDIPAAMRLKEFAGWNQTASDWNRFLAENPEGCFVMEVEGLVRGSVTTIIYGGHLAWIGMVLVHPEHRGRGIGTRLLERAINYLDARGVRTTKLDATPLGLPIYERLGFRREFEIERWMLQRVRGSPKPQMWNATASEDILKLDCEVFGANRSSLLRSLAAEAREFTLMKTRYGKVVGYAFGRRGSHADQLGPWVARDEGTARKLLAGFLSRSTRDRIISDCIKSNPWAQSLVAAQGFEFSRPLTRMFRGANDSPGRQTFLGAILGPEFG